VNESALYSSSTISSGLNIDELTGLDLTNPDDTSQVNINYAFKYIRFIHAQMSANPPTVIPVPTSQDVEDLEASRGADKVIQYGRRKYNIQEVQDRVTNDTLVYGNGWFDLRWDPSKGKLRKVKKESNSVTMSGDISFKRRSPWDIWIDPEADCWEDCRYVFIRHSVPKDKALYLFPQHKDAILSSTSHVKKDNFFDSSLQTESDAVEVYEYIEKGFPWNGMVGRYVWMLDSGLLLSPLAKSPFPNAELPIYPLTDIDVPGLVYGKAVTDYVVRPQEILSALDSTVLMNIQAHGSVRLILPDGADLQDSGLTNNGWEYTKIAGGSQAPIFMQPAQLMPDMHKFRDQLVMGIQELIGVNESMMGQQQREVSALSQQTAIEAGNVIRRRLFNKYTSAIKWVYETLIANVVEYWDDPHKVEVTGEEGTLSVAYLSGADVASGFSFQADYGSSFSLDPARRREEIMQLTPMLKEAGISVKTILSKLKLNDIEGALDISELAQRRQAEIFEEMIGKFEQATPVNIPPREIQEHASMLEYAYIFIHTKRFDNLKEEVKNFIERHIKDREALVAKTAQPAAGAGQPPMDGAMAAPMAPIPGVMA
jgi:hypothetical protein